MTEKNSRKKAKERLYLEAFRRHYAGFPEGAIEASESPDFLLVSDSRCIGIEVTEVFQDGSGTEGSLLKAQEGEWERAIRNACGVYEERMLPPVLVDVGWDSNYRITRSRRRTLEAELVRSVENATPEPNDFRQVDQTGLPESPLPKEVAYLSVARFDGVSESEWNYSRGGFVSALTPEDIDLILVGKEERIQAYQEGCKELWLLIVLEGLHESSLLRVAQEVRGSVFQTRFQKLFVLSCSEGNVVDLRTRPRI